MGVGAAPTDTPPPTVTAPPTVTTVAGAATRPLWTVTTGFRRSVAHVHRSGRAKPLGVAPFLAAMACAACGKHRRYDFGAKWEN